MVDVILYFFVILKLILQNINYNVLLVKTETYTFT